MAILFFCALFPAEGFPQTSIMKWQDGKEGCASLTFDDGSINQFRIAVPILNERGLHATFFIITGGIPGSKYQPKFIGRPVQKIIKESKSIPTRETNLFERCSALYYLAQTGKYPEIEKFSNMDAAIGVQYEEGKYKEVYSIIDSAYATLREGGHVYNFKDVEVKPDTGYHLTWDILRKVDEEGHEIANHSVTHPYMPVMSKANLLYEIEKCSLDMEKHLNRNRILSIECPYGVGDKRVLKYAFELFPFVRNGLEDKFIKEILRGEPGEPVSKDKEYVQWQRGPLSKTPLSEMEGWIDTVMKDSAWLVLVFHGVEGIGWEAIPKEKFAEYFDYIKAEENNLWVATFQDAYKYVRERMNAKVKTKSDKGKITITLLHKLNREIYNLPLTLKTFVPATWRSAIVQQGQQKVDVKVQNDGTKAFIQYRAMPNRGNVVLTKISE